MHQTDLIHIGLPKTGTTSLQARYAQQSGIRFLGPAPGQQPNLTRAISHAVLAASDAEFRAARQTLCAALPEDGTPRVLSNEELTLGRHAKRAQAWTFSADPTPVIAAWRLAALFPRAHVLIVLRNQADWLQSYYRQMRRVGMMRTDFVTWLREALSPGAPGYLDFTLDYSEMVQGYSQFFGPHKVHVYFYEDIASDLDRLYREVAEKLGLPCDTAPVPHLNRRGGVDPAFRRLLGGVVPLGMIKRRCPVVFDLAKQLMPQEKQTPSIPADQRAAICTHFAATNNALREMLGRDLPSGYLP